MARQHFYSRVPFRVSMFNRADGPDTFACSDGVEREFIDKELDVVCDNKPTSEDAVLIRKGEISPLYCVFTAKDGTLVQSCTTFFPLDYTGERSTYLVHNLLFSPQEAESVFYSTARSPINVDMFDHDIDHFDITSPNAKPNSKYPNLDYKCLPAEDTSWMVETLDGAMLQRLVYTFVSVACGSLKSVYLLLPDNSNDYVIRLYNSLYGIFPFHLRPQLSFVSRLSDVSKFQSIKIKCMSGNFVVPPAKGAMLNFKTNQYTGMKDEEIQQQRLVVEFFFSMLENNAIREEFLVFCDKAVKAAPALAQPNMKMLTNLVFMFKASSGLYEERLVLSTDDKLLEFFTIYEKFRDALSSEFRTNAMKSLRRYPNNHAAIPPKIFSKVSKIYPTDLPGVRFIILQVVLELIHMDIMRDKLFAFVKANYASQTREEKDEIIKNISRVFYGGFLQSQILTFFEQIFLDESPESQRDIIDKLLLSIRNKDVKDQIIEFLNNNIKGFTPEIRHAVYLASIEHIQEGDAIASKLVDLIDANIPDEPDEERTWFELKLISAVKAEQRKRSHPMIKLLATKQGYCSRLVLGKVFNEELGKKAYTEVVAGFCTGTLKDLALSLKQAMPLFPDVDEETNDRLFTTIKECMEAEHKKFDLPLVIAADQIIAQCYEDEEEPFAVLFWQEFSEVFIASAVSEAIPDVFRYLSQPQILDDAFGIAEKYESVKSTDGYKRMLCYKKMEEAVGNGNVEQLVKAADGMPEEIIRRKQVGDFMKKNLWEKINSGSPEICAASLGIITFLQSGKYDFTGMFDLARQKLEGDAPEETQPAKGKKAPPANDYALEAITIVLNFGNTVNSLCGEKMKEALYSDASMLSGALNSYVGQGKNQENKKINAVISALRPENNDFAVKCGSLVKGAAKPSFFANLFRKK